MAGNADRCRHHTSLPDHRRPRLQPAAMKGSTIAAVLFAVTAAGFALLAPVSDPDIFWHLASGDWMLDHAQLLDRDVFSFTRTGVAYHTGEWLGGIILALPLRAGRLPGPLLPRAAMRGAWTLFAGPA